MPGRILYLVRHGAITVDERERYVGQLDVPLSPAGVAQARALGQILLPAPITRIYSSDLQRCRETAEILAGGRAIKIVLRRDLREISLGLWEGCVRADIAKRHPEEFKARGADIEHFRPLGGERFADCSLRVTTAFKEILDQSTGDIAIVGHAGVNRLILCELLGIPISNLFKIGQDHGSLTIVQFENSDCRVKLLNFTARAGATFAGEQVTESEAVPIP